MHHISYLAFGKMMHVLHKVAILDLLLDLGARISHFS